MRFARPLPKAMLIIIHDAARPFVSESLISETVAAAATYGAAIAAIGVHDTVKRVRTSDGAEADGTPHRVVTETIPEGVDLPCADAAGIPARGAGGRAFSRRAGPSRRD